MNVRRRTLSTSIAGVTVALTVVGFTGAITAGAAPDTRPVPNSAPRWVSHAKNLGHVSSAAPVTFRVYLAPNGGLDALKAAVARVSDPQSGSYRKFLSAAQYHAQYDPTSASLNLVKKWLGDDGLSATSVEPSRRYLVVSGTVASAQHAFGVAIDRYDHDGRQVQANATALTVPTAIAPSILTVTGLDTTPRIVKHDSAPPPAGFANARPCSLSYGQLLASKEADFRTPLPKFNGKTLPYAVCGYTGPQYRSAYENNLSAGLDGTGVTVGITDAYAAPTIGADANQYATSHGDGGYPKGQLKQVLPGSFNSESACGASGWYGEETLDVEAVHAMAPGASIRYYGAASCFDTDLIATLAKVVDQNKVQIVSNSWGDLEANESTDSIAAYQEIFIQGAMQGISFMFSSGDNGDELANTGVKQADYPTSDPYVTSVGGTSDAIGADGTFKFQTGWGTQRYSLNATQSGWDSPSYLYGAGGGGSALFNQPAYQNGVVPAGFSDVRAVPDVGLDADPNTGMLVGETQTFPEGVRYGEYRIGGTSLASPLFAGMTALLLQNAGGGLGFLNPTIYGQIARGTFTDIKGSPADAGNVRVDYINGVSQAGGLRYTVRTFNQDSSLTITKGWDDVTGVGSPNSTWVTSVSKH
jgi:subtilase family serine protease